MNNRNLREKGFKTTNLLKKRKKKKMPAMLSPIKPVDNIPRITKDMNLINLFRNKPAKKQMECFKFCEVIRPLPKADRGSKGIFSCEINNQSCTTGIIDIRSTIEICPRKGIIDCFRLYNTNRAFVSRRWYAVKNSSSLSCQVC